MGMKANFFSIIRGISKIKAINPGEMILDKLIKIIVRKFFNKLEVILKCIICDWLFVIYFAIEGGQ